MAFRDTFPKVVHGIKEGGGDPSVLCAIMVLSLATEFTRMNPILFGSSALFWVRMLKNHSIPTIVSLYLQNPPSDIDVYFRHYSNYLAVCTYLLMELPGITLLETLSLATSSHVPSSFAVTKLKLNFNLVDYDERTNPITKSHYFDIQSMINFDFMIDLVYLHKHRRSYRFIDEIFEVNLFNSKYEIFDIRRIDKNPDHRIEESLITSVKVAQKRLSKTLMTPEIYADKFYEFSVNGDFDIPIFIELDLGHRFLTS